MTATAHPANRGASRGGVPDGGGDSGGGTDGGGGTDSDGTASGGAAGVRQDPGRGGRRRWRPLTRGAVVAVGVAVGVVVLVRLTSTVPTDLGYAATALLAGLSCLVAAVRPRGRDRAAWALMAKGQLLLAAALLLAGPEGPTAVAGGPPAALAVQVLLLGASGDQALALAALAHGRGARRLGVFAGYALLVCSLVLTVAWAWGLPQLLRLPADDRLLSAALLVHLVVAVVGGALLLALWSGGAGTIRVPLLPQVALSVSTVAQLWALASATLDVWAPSWWVLSLTAGATAVMAVAPWCGGESGTRSRPATHAHAWVLLTLAVASALLLLLAGQRAADVWVLRGAAVSLVVTVVLMTWRGHEVWQLNRRLAESEEHFRTLVTDATDVLLRLDPGGKVVYASPSVHTTLGYPPSQVRGTTWRDLVEAADHPQANRWLEAQQEGSRAHLRVRHRDGTPIWMEAVLSGSDRGRVLLSLRDIREQVRLAAELRRAATRDALTGLLNRTAFEMELEHRLRSHRGHREAGVTVLFGDLDGFKTVNDVAGHAAGDDVIAAVAERLGAVLLARDVLARFGGDEFAVLCAPGTSRSHALELAEQAVAAVASPFRVAGRSFDLSLSVGVAIAEPPAHGGTPSADGGCPDATQRDAVAGGSAASALLRDADIAMYRSKGAGRGQVTLFLPAMRRELLERLETASRIRVAIDDSRLQLRYQPQVSLADGRVLGFEALVRWRGRDDTPVATEAVIAEAEATGQIVELGRQVLLEAVTDAAGWHRAGLRVGVSVNLSPRQLDSARLVDDVRGSLHRTGLPPGALTLEVTETMLPQSLETLDQLRELGVRLAVDDFGTGYAGLAQLRRIPADELKIDRTFLEGAGRIPERTSLLTSIARMGADLGMDLVGEGVESLAQARLLSSLGVGAGQGFAFAGAIPASAVPQFVVAGRFDLRDRADADVPGRVLRLPAVDDPGEADDPAALARGPVDEQAV